MRRRRKAWHLIMVGVAFLLMLLMPEKIDAESTAGLTDGIYKEPDAIHDGVAAAGRKLCDAACGMLADASMRVDSCAADVVLANDADVTEEWMADYFPYVGARGMRPLTAAEEEYLLRVLTQEVGTDEALSWCVVQCLCYKKCGFGR